MRARKARKSRNPGQGFLVTPKAKCTQRENDRRAAPRDKRINGPRVDVGTARMRKHAGGKAHHRAITEQHYKRHLPTR